MRWLLVIAALFWTSGFEATQVRSHRFELQYSVAQTDDAEARPKAAEILRQRLEPAAEWGGVEVDVSIDGKLFVRFGRELNAEEQRDARQRVESKGTLLLAPMADAHTPGIDFAEENLRYDAWRSAHPAASLDEFNALSSTNGGPSRGIYWYAFAAWTDVPQRKPAPCIDTTVIDQHADWVFSRADVTDLAATVGDHNQPQIFFKFVSSRASAFRELTTRYTNRCLAIVIDDRIVSAPLIAEPLPGAGVIDCPQWTAKERDSILRTLRLGPLPIVVEFVAARTVD